MVWLDRTTDIFIIGEPPPPRGAQATVALGATDLFIGVNAVDYSGSVETIMS